MTDAQPQALVKRTADSALMPPPPPPKRQKRPAIVLDEDEYSQAVSDIIARDYFPGLRETQAQAEYLEAVASKDNSWIREASKNLTEVMTPGPEKRNRLGRGTSFSRGVSTSGNTPHGQLTETSGRTPVSISSTGEMPPLDINMSLSAFQAKYTSEDNESFNALLDKQNAQKAAKYAFFHSGNKIPTARQIAHRAREQKLLEHGKIISTAQVASHAADSDQSDSGVVRPSQDLGLRPASLDGFPNRQGPRNHFMFGPDGVEDHLRDDLQPKNRSLEAPPRFVNYSNTRLLSSSHSESRSSVPPSPTMSAIDAAIAGRPKATESEPGYTGAETPRVNGYAFVDAEPTPSELGIPVDEDEVDATEREAASKFLPRLDSSGPNPFKIVEQSKREDLHRRLVEKADAGRRSASKIDTLRSLGITPSRTATPNLGSRGDRRGTSMTPAARRLADRISTPRRSGDIFAERSHWTPTPRVKRST